MVVAAGAPEAQRRSKTQSGVANSVHLFLVPVHEEWAFGLKEALQNLFLLLSFVIHAKPGLLFNKISGDFLYLLGPRSIASARSLQRAGAVIEGVIKQTIRMF